MKRQLVKNKNIIIFFASLFLTIAAYLVFISSSYYNVFLLWAQNNTYLLLSLLVAIKVIGIIWPPIPGGFLSLGSIPFIGWEKAYLSDLIGNILGSIITYHIGRKYGYSILNKLFDENMVKKIKKIKIKKSKSFEMVFLYRVLGTSVLLEVITYGAGILRLPFWPFLTASVIAHVIYNLPAYYLINVAIFGLNPLLILVSIIALVVLIYKTKGRYFE